MGKWMLKSIDLRNSRVVIIILSINKISFFSFNTALGKWGGGGEVKGCEFSLVSSMWLNTDPLQDSSRSLLSRYHIMRAQCLQDKPFTLQAHLSVYSRSSLWSTLQGHQIHIC